MSESIAELDIEALASVIHDARWDQGSAASTWVPFTDETGTGKVYSLRIANAVQMHLLRLAADHVRDVPKLIEPVPATNQAGEVERSYETSDQATSRVTKAAITESLDVIAKAFDDLLIDRDEWRAQHEALLDVRQQDLAALATQPATSQEGEGEEKTDWWNGFTGDFLTDGKGQASTAVWDRCRAAFHAAWPSGKIAAVDAAIEALAATPTPPTLSEDLQVMREALESIADFPGPGSVTMATARAALAQVKAS